MVKPLRDELYCQLIKQLSNNTNPSSRSKGWDLMLLCIAHFPPNGEMENYLEMFLRQKSQPPDKYVNLHHQTLYHGERHAPPTEADIQQILQGGNVERSISSLPREQAMAMASEGLIGAPQSHHGGGGYGRGAPPGGAP